MKKFAALYLTPIIAILLILIQIRDVESYIEAYNKYGIWYLSGFLVVATLFNHYITVYSPYERYERLAKNRWFTLDREGKILVDKYQNQGFDIRINIMVANRNFFTFAEPWNIWGREFKKPVFFGKVFSPIWSYGNYSVNKELKITTNQGTCGKAYRSANNPIGAEFVSGRQYNFNFSKKQKQLTENLKIVVSYRIVEDVQTPEKKSDKMVGVLNFESETSGSEILLLDLQKRKDFYDDIVGLSNIYSKLL